MLYFRIKEFCSILCILGKTWLYIVLHDLNLTYYSSIILGSFSILLFPKLCWHIGLTPIANIPHLLIPVPNRKSRLGANFYQPLVVEICRNTCTSRGKTLQLLQNHSVSHHTHSHHSSISFLWFRAICGS